MKDNDVKQKIVEQKPVMTPLRQQGAIWGMAIMMMIPHSVAAQDLLPPEDVRGEFSANVAVATDYVFRGFSQTGRRPAVSGGFDYSVGTGMSDIDFYAGIWGSNISGTKSNIELDYYTGFTGSLPVGDGLGWDVGFLYYDYPGSSKEDEFDYWEIYGNMGYDFQFFSLGTGVYYSPDYYGGIGQSLYVSVDTTIPLHESLYLAGSFGRLMDLAANSGKEFDQGNDWSVGAGVTLLGFDWSVTYHDTNGYATNQKTVVGALSKSF